MQTHRLSPNKVVPFLDKKVGEGNVLHGSRFVDLSELKAQVTTALHVNGTTGERTEPKPLIYATNSAETAVFYILYQLIREARFNRGGGIRSTLNKDTLLPTHEHFLSPRGKQLATALEGDIGSVYYTPEKEFTYDPDEGEWIRFSPIEPLGRMVIQAACLHCLSFDLARLPAPNDDPAIRTSLDANGIPPETPAIP